MTGLGVTPVPLAYGGTSTVEMALWGVVLLAGLLGTLGAGYLLYVDTIIVHYTSFFKIIAFGLLVFVLTAPVVFLYAVEFIHAVHALAAAVISVGLYTLIRSEIRPDRYGSPTEEDDSEDFEESIPELVLDDE